MASWVILLQQNNGWNCCSKSRQLHPQEVMQVNYKQSTEGELLSSVWTTTPSPPTPRKRSTRIHSWCRQQAGRPFFQLKVPSNDPDRQKNSELSWAVCVCVCTCAQHNVSMKVRGQLLGDKTKVVKLGSLSVFFFFLLTKYMINVQTPISSL